MRALLALLLILLPACSSTPITSRVGVVYEQPSYVTEGTILQARLIRPRGNGPFPAVIVVHGDHGPTAKVSDAAVKLADNGFVALIVDLHRGEKVKDDLEAHILDRALPEERVRGDLHSALDYLASRRDVRPGSFGILGLDSGGGTALDFACREPRLKAVVTCYGRLITDADLLRPLNASVLGIFAEKDIGINDATRQSFQKAMEKAGKTVAGLHVIAGAEHGFLAPTASQKDPTDDALHEAWTRILAYLKQTLTP